jgi:uncharacterized membrane protein YkoI
MLAAPLRPFSLEYHAGMLRRILTAVTLLLAATFAAAQPTVRDGRDPAQRNGFGQPQSRTLGSSEAAAIARSATGGRVLDVASAGNVYLVRVLLADGRVRTVRVDASTGLVR